MVAETTQPQTTLWTFQCSVLLMLRGGVGCRVVEGREESEVRGGGVKNNFCFTNKGFLMVTHMRNLP